VPSDIVVKRIRFLSSWFLSEHFAHNLALFTGEPAAAVESHVAPLVRLLQICQLHRLPEVVVHAAHEWHQVMRRYNWGNDLYNIVKLVQENVNSELLVNAKVLAIERHCDLHIQPHAVVLAFNMDCRHWRVVGDLLRQEFIAVGCVLIGLAQQRVKWLMIALFHACKRCQPVNRNEADSLHRVFFLRS